MFLLPNAVERQNADVWFHPYADASCMCDLGLHGIAWNYPASKQCSLIKSLWDRPIVS